MLPNEIIRYTLNNVTERDKVYFALTCKKWMNWVIDHIVFKTFITYKVINQSSFIFSNLRLVISHPILPTVKMMNVTYLKLKISDYPKTDDIANECFKRLVNVKCLDFSWDGNVHYDELNPLKFNIPKSVNLLTTLSIHWFNHDIANIFINDNESPKLGVQLIYSGKKMVMYNSPNAQITINNSQCTYLRILRHTNIDVSTPCLKNLEVLKCSDNWRCTNIDVDVSTPCFDNLKELIIEFQSALSPLVKYDWDKSLLLRYSFPKMEVLNINRNFDLEYRDTQDLNDILNNIKDCSFMKTLKELNIFIGGMFSSKSPARYGQDKMIDKHIDVSFIKQMYPNLTVTLIKTELIYSIM